MLSLSQKESILRKKNVTIPAFPTRPLFLRFHCDDDNLISPMHEDEERQLRIAIAGWRAEIEALYETHIRRPVEFAVPTIKYNASSGSANT